MLKTIYQNLLSCNACALAQNRAAVVPGRGNPESRIVIIGEAPGLKEVTWKNDKGEPYPSPFVGKAGENLNSFLARAGIKREEVFITNTVKCRPTKGNLGKANRPPTVKEINACGSWLEAELEVLRPGLIITLGNVPLRRLTGQGNIGAVHGEVQNYRGIAVFPMYHPAAVIYRRELLPVIEEDLCKLKLLCCGNPLCSGLSAGD